MLQCISSTLWTINKLKWSSQFKAGLMTHFLFCYLLVYLLLWNVLIHSFAGDQLNLHTSILWHVSVYAYLYVQKHLNTSPFSHCWVGKQCLFKCNSVICFVFFFTKTVLFKVLIKSYVQNCSVFTTFPGMFVLI